MPWLIFVVAFAVRLVHIWQIKPSPFFDVLLGDARGYDEWARRLAGGDWIGTEVFYQAPLYPYYLGVLYKLLGHDLLIVRICQAAIGSASCALLALAGERFFSKRVGLIAGLALALYAPAIFFDGIVQKASLTCLLVCALFAAVSWYGTTSQGTERELEKQQARRLRSGFGNELLGALVIGVLGGLLSITRENAMVWIPILGVWAWAETPKRRNAETQKTETPKHRNAETPKHGNEPRSDEATLRNCSGQAPPRSGGRNRRWAAVGAYVLGVAIVLVLAFDKAV